MAKLAPAKKEGNSESGSDTENSETETKNEDHSGKSADTEVAEGKKA